MKNLIKLKTGRLYIFVLLIFLSGVVCLAQNEKMRETKFNLIVTDKKGNFVNSLSKNDISVFIDGKEQTDFTLETENPPLLYMIAVDNSGSMRLFLEAIITAAKTLVEKNKAEDLTSLMRFISADKIQPLEKFTSDRDSLFKILDAYYIEGGQTALVDAIYKSVELVAAQKAANDNTRRVVVVISDGEDRDSFYTKSKLLELLKKEHVQIFFIGLVHQLSNESGTQEVLIMDKDKKFKKVQQKYENKRKPAIEFIESLARESGGAAIFPGNKQKISDVATQIAAQMQTQLVVKFSTVETTDGKKIEIKPTKSAEKKELKFSYRADFPK